MVTRLSEDFQRISSGKCDRKQVVVCKTEKRQEEGSQGAYGLTRDRPGDEEPSVQGRIPVIEDRASSRENTCPPPRLKTPAAPRMLFTLDFVLALVCYSSTWVRLF